MFLAMITMITLFVLNYVYLVVYCISYCIEKKMVYFCNLCAKCTLVMLLLICFFL